LKEKETGKLSKNNPPPLVMSSLEALFRAVDDFCKVFIPAWRKQQLPGHVKQRNFKHFYLDQVCVYWADAFPTLPS